VLKCIEDYAAAGVSAGLVYSDPSVFDPEIKPG